MNCCGKTQSISFLFLLTYALIANAEEIVNKEAIGVSGSESKACEKALLIAKKKALSEAGSIIESNVNSLIQQKDGVVDVAASRNIKEFARGLVKVKASSQEVRKMATGEFVCQISATLSVDILNVTKQNKRYKGQLPDWVVSRPKILGKNAIIGDAETLKGAFAVALHKYLINDKLIDRNITFKHFKDQYFDKDDFTKFYQVKTVKVSEKLSLASMIKWELEEGDLVQTDTLNVTYKDSGPKMKHYGGRGMKYYYTSSQNLNKSNKDDYVFNHSKHKQDATLEELFAHTKAIGLEIEFEKVDSASVSRWYVMLIGEDHKNRLETLAKKGDMVEQHRVGNYYLTGTYFSKDFDKGLLYLEASAKQGYTKSMLTLGDVYTSLKGYVDYKKAMDSYLGASLDKDHFISGVAYVAMGDMYKNGLGVEKSNAVAKVLYKKAANNKYGEHSVQANMNLGDMYFNAEGVKKDYQQALNWYLKAAKIESQYLSTSAMYKIAEMYYSGHGVKQNDAKAVEWYKKSANRSVAWGSDSANSNAQYSLGFMYMHGRGVIKSLKKAYQWHTKAAKNNNIWAQEAVSSGYALCKISCDGEKAVFWAKRLIKRSATLKSSSRLAIIAAAFARAGEFESAVEYQMKAIEVLPNTEDDRLFVINLKRYKRGEATKGI